MTIKKCERKEYEALLVMLNRAFGYKDNWFERNLSTCTPYEKIATDEQISRHYIAVKDNEIIGCVGAYPRELAIGGALTVNGFGIGQVSCKKEERGQGVMSALMDAAIDSEVKEGAVLSYLWGDIPRYGHFGFKPAGGKIEFSSIKARRISQSVDMDGFDARKPELSDIEAMAKLYSRFEARVIRKGEHWQESLKRENFECLFTQGNDGGAYLFAKANEKIIVEIQGDVAATRKLLIYYAQKRGFDELAVHYPYMWHGCDRLYNFLKENTSWYTVQPAALAAAFGSSGDIEQLNPIFGIGEKRYTFWISEIDYV